MKYTRRQIIRAFALGGAVVAGELWIPGQRLISLPSPRLTEDDLERAVARFLLANQEIVRFRDLWIVASANGGALQSKDGIHWQAIHPTELYHNGDRVVEVTVTHEMLEDIRCS